MSCPLKFRAWKTRLPFSDAASEEMVYFEITDLDGSYIVSSKTYIDGDECVIMQAIGYKDESGKEIYEGDILDRCGDNFNSVVEYQLPPDRETPGFYVVENRPKGDDTKYYPRTHFIPHLTIAPIVIGNIYENPELIEQHNYEEI